MERRTYVFFTMFEATHVIPLPSVNAKQASSRSLTNLTVVIVLGRYLQNFALELVFSVFALYWKSRRT